MATSPSIRPPRAFAGAAARAQWSPQGFFGLIIVALRRLWSHLALMLDLIAFSLRALDEAEGRAVVCQQGLQGGLFGASGASQPGSMEERGAPSC